MGKQLNLFAFSLISKLWIFSHFVWLLQLPSSLLQVYMDGTSTMSTQERKASLGEFYGEFSFSFTETFLPPHILFCGLFWTGSPFALGVATLVNLVNLLQNFKAERLLRTCFCNLLQSPQSFNLPILCFQGSKLLFCFCVLYTTALSTHIRGLRLGLIATRLNNVSQTELMVWI